MVTRTTSDTGGAGTYYVAAELLRRGWAASVTYGNAPRTDILAAVGAKQLPAAIQVKTKGERSANFQLGGIADPALPQANEWVFLVALHDEQPPDYFVIPRDDCWATVAAFRLARGPDHRVALGPHEFAAYQGAWLLLEQASWDAQCSVRPWVANCAEVALADGASAESMLRVKRRLRSAAQAHQST